MLSLESTRRRNAPSVWLSVAAVAMLLGCGGSDLPKLVDYLEEIELDVPLESATYVSLGKFDVPIATTPNVSDIPAEHESDDEATWLRLQFELSAETTAANEHKVAAAVAHRRGALSDAVISILRTSSVDELIDPKLSAVKTRLTEVARPMLGDAPIRQLILTEFDADALAHADAEPAHEEAHGHH